MSEKMSPTWIHFQWFVMVGGKWWLHHRTLSVFWKIFIYSKIQSKSNCKISWGFLDRIYLKQLYFQQNIVFKVLNLKTNCLIYKQVPSKMQLLLKSRKEKTRHFQKLATRKKYTIFGLMKLSENNSPMR